MDNQLSLFDSSYINFNDKINAMLNEVITSQELPESSLRLVSNVSLRGKGKGNQTSQTICIYEPEYPPVPNRSINYTVHRILRLDQTNNITLYVRNDIVESVPESATILRGSSDNVFTRIVFSNTDDSIVNYIKEKILYSLSHYTSGNVFGCCSKYIECSNQRRCIHENKLYSKSCCYRKNLESNKIFYGCNKNV